MAALTQNFLLTCATLTSLSVSAITHVSANIRLSQPGTTSLVALLLSWKKCFFPPSVDYISTDAVINGKPLSYEL